MSNNYQIKKDRRLEILRSLPDNLRDRIALRNAMAAARLTTKQQQVLAKAMDIGLKRVPTALRYLKTHPDASAQELFRASFTHKNNHPGKKDTQIQSPNNTAILVAAFTLGTLFGLFISHNKHGKYYGQ